MTLTELRYIIAVAREQHFGRAAKACFVSQPTLSVAVRRLEDELGVILFERGIGEITITPIGWQVVEQAQRVLEEAERLKHIAQQGQDDLVGILRLGVIYTIGPYLLPHLVPLLRRRAPQMSLEIEENYTAVIGEQLKQGKLDALILSLPFEEQGIAIEPLYREPFVVLMPSGHMLEKNTTISAQELAEQDLLLLGSGHCFRDQVLQFCPECNRTSVSSNNIQKTLEGSSLETIRLMVATGMGITVLPETSVYNYPYAADLLTVRRFVEPGPQRIVALAWRRSFPRLGAIQVLAETIRACPLGEQIQILTPSSPSTDNKDLSLV